MNKGPSDELLMLAYRDGDASAFEVLYSRYRGPMFRYLLRQCGNASVAEELFQDVWMNLIRARERYEVKAAFSTFVFQMAHNRLIDYYRKVSGKLPVSYDDDLEDSQSWLVDDGQPSIDAQVDTLRQVERLLQAIDQLPEAQREAFLLKEEGGLSLEEIADATGVNRETVKSRLRYAVNKLRKHFESGID
jgi:RNA polymerase sigma-70 factor (ECF subfamily)